MAGLQYEDEAKRPSSTTKSTPSSSASPIQLPSRRVGAGASAGSPANTRCANPYSTCISDDDLGDNTAQETVPITTNIPSPEHQPMASQWAAIRNLSDETEVHHKRFQQLAAELGNPIISKLRNAYPDARSIRNTGILLFKDVLDGFRPQKLKDIFAFASLSYAISQLLFSRGRIDKSEILGGLRSWRDLISDEQERHAFSTLAQELWPEAKDHLHFIPIPRGIRTPPVPNVWPRDVVASGVTESVAMEGGFFSRSNPAAGTTSDPLQSSCFDATNLEPDSADILDFDLVPGLTDLTDNTHHEFDFAAFGSVCHQAHHQYPTAMNAPQPISVLPERDPDPRPQIPPREALFDVPTEDDGGPQLSNTTPNAVRIEETLMFLVIFVFFQDISQLLYVLSGRSLDSRRYKLYNAEEEDQKRFYHSAQKLFFSPRGKDHNSSRPTFLALLSVAEVFTKRGSLRTIPEIKHYLVGVAAVPPSNQ